MERVLRIFAWSLVGILLAVLTVLGIANNYSAVLPMIVGVGAFFLAILVLIVIAQPPRVKRRRRAALVLTYLEQAVRLNLPLPDFIAAAARTERGVTAARLRRLQRELEAGPQIVLALQRAVPEVSNRTLSLLRVAERAGQLPVALDRLASEQSLRQNADPLDQAFISAYPPLMSAVILLIWSVMAVFVMPRFQQIFRDFHTPLPRPTQQLLALSAALNNQPWLLLVVAAIALICFGWTWLPREAARRWLPTGWLVRDRDLADVCEIVADATRASMPLPDALDNAAELQVSRSLRRRLRRWSVGLGAGQGAAQAAAAAGMPALIANLVADRDSAAAAETFGFLARYYRSRFSRLAELARGAVIPLLVFIFAVPVLWLALSLFLPLVRLVDTVGPYRSLF